MTPVGPATTLSRRDLLGYGVLALPLSMAALPIYVHVPKFYGDTLGIDLALVGFILLALRALDCVIDPLLGAWSDRLPSRAIPITWSLVPLALGMIALFSPLPDSTGGRAIWLAATLAVVYASFSLATINHGAWGAELSSDPHQRTRITATREALALVGVIAGAVIPGWFGSEASGLAWLSVIFAALLVACGAWTLLYAPRSPRAATAPRRLRELLPEALANIRFRRLLSVYMINGIAAAIPATLVLFFIQDVIGAAEKQGAFLAVYFVTGALAMPFWIALARRIGKERAWLAGMMLAIATFIWALRLGPGDSAAFFVICAASGVALSADLALPPSMLADAIEQGPRDLGAGTYFGVWTMATKLNLALAAGVALPLVGWLGYRPGGGVVAADGSHVHALSIVYAGVPCALKLLAAAMCWQLIPRNARSGRDPADISHPTSFAKPPIGDVPLAGHTKEIQCSIPAGRDGSLPSSSPPHSFKDAPL